MSSPHSSTAVAPLALDVQSLTVAYRDKIILRDVNCEIPRGTLLGIIGPNGAGKTTFIKAVLELIPRLRGEVRIFGQPLRAVRRKVAYVPQRSSVDWDFPTTVLDAVMMGTYGQLGWFRRPGPAQTALARDALARVGLQDLEHRPIGQLSGGQQQRVFLARALAQAAEVYCLDEPFQGVDLPTEQAIIQLLKHLRDQGQTVLVVHHDLSTVADYFDRVMLLNQTVIALGATAEVFTTDHLAKTYGQQLRPWSV